MSALTPTEPRRSNAVLIVSLCLNLVLAGIIAMALVRFFWFRPMLPVGGAQLSDRVSVRQVLAPRMLMHIAPDKAAQIRDLARSHRDRFEAVRADAADARRQVLAVYGAPAFDKAALEKALAHMQAADGAVEGEVFKLAVETASVLSPEERKRVSEWRGRGGLGWQGHGHGPGHPMDGGPPPDGARP
jgi:uncharacterized membrane protein